MAPRITLEALLRGCADDSFEDGIRIDTELEPVAGPGGPVKPAIYEGGRYQHDRRWAKPSDDEPTPVIVIDNVPSQANRLEDAIRRHRDTALAPELVLDLSAENHLPAHLPRQISSLQFPHRNADAYLRDAMLDDQDFLRTDMGRSIFGATAGTCGPLMAWFPQSLLYGFWQSHLGKKRHNTKHARAWVSEIVGWNPAATDTRALGMKGDPLNLSIDEKVTFDKDDLTTWGIGPSGPTKKKSARSAAARDEADDKSGDKKKPPRLSNIGHGQAPFMKNDAAPAAVSFAWVSQRATVSFAQLRRISLGPDHSKEQDAAARALLVALGLHAHVLAFGRSFALRSGAELRPRTTTTTWLGSENDAERDLAGAETSGALLAEAHANAASENVPVDGWRKPALILTPKENLSRAIHATWPELAD